MNKDKIKWNLTRKRFQENANRKVVDFKIN